MDHFQQLLLNTVSTRIRREVEDGDEKNRGQIWALWKNISPAPQCIDSSALCTLIQEITVPAYAARARSIAEVVHVDLSDVPLSAITEIRKPLMQLVEALLADPYHQLIAATPGVYDRQNAPPHKFLKASFDLRLAQMQTTAINATRRGLEDIELALDAAALKAQLRERRTGLAHAVSINILGSTVGAVQTGDNAISHISRQQANDSSREMTGL